MTETTEFSFLLKPSPTHGIGVFAAHNIAAGTHLRLFGTNVRELPSEAVPEEFQSYCVHRETTLWCPLDFGAMHIGWYLNHSEHPNAFHKEYEYYALTDIQKGEEVTIDYKTLEEPPEKSTTG